jgi:hypothetical protein
VYVPTQDSDQQQRLFLTHLTQHVLMGSAAAACSPASATSSTPQARAAAGGVCAAVCAAVHQVLELEYRAVTCELPSLWSVLSSTMAAADERDVSQHEEEDAGGGVKKDGTDVSTSTVNVTTLHNSNSRRAAAVACMCNLVEAYGELRQLHVLLESLAAACSGGGGCDSALAATHLTVLVTHPQVAKCVTTAVSGMPPGRVTHQRYP